MHCFPGLPQYHKLGGLKHQKFILSEFWRLEVQNQDISKAMFPLRLWIESFFAFFFFFLALMASVSSWCSLDYRHIIPVSTSISIWSFFLISLYCQLIRTSLNFLGSSDGKESACVAETWVQSLGLWYSFFFFFFFCDLMDCSPSGSSGNGISQARILEWVAIAYSVCGILAWRIP